MQKSNLIEQCIQDCKDQISRLNEDPGAITRQVVERNCCCKCPNDTCANQGQGLTGWEQRINTQVDRFFHGVEGDPNLPQYKEVLRKDFEDMTQHAMRLIISNQKGDWEVPDTAALVSPVQAQAQSEQRIKAMLEALPGPEKVAILEDDEGVEEDFEELYPDFVGDLALPPEEMVHTPAKVRPRITPQKVEAPPVQVNVPRKSGVMLGGGQSPVEKEVADPWAVPVHRAKSTKIEVGGTFSFGSPPPDPKGKKP